MNGIAPKKRGKLHSFFALFCSGPTFRPSNAVSFLAYTLYLGYLRKKIRWCKVWSGSCNSRVFYVPLS